MSYFDDASLVMIPSGYKTSKVYSVKPTDGSGDLTFSRSNDTATRVNSAGLIEKVRTNYVLQSNTFSTTWLATDLTVTSGATDPNGGTTAWTAAATAASGIIQQTVTLTGLRTFSIYAKQGTLRYLYMGAYGGTISYATFDLQDGVVAAGTNARIESVGGGWYRCTCHSADGTTGGVQILPTDTISSGTIGTGNILIWRAQYEAGDIATDYIATTSAAVSVGPVANVPRLDYLNSSCPRLLLEPQRTNLFTYSEQLNTGTSGATATPNQAVSPDGYTNADLITGAGANNYIAKGISGAFSGTHTFSIFLKAGTDSAVGLDIYDGSYYNATYNLATGVASGTGASMVSYGNGWYRCILTRTTSANPVEVSVSSIGNGLTIYAWGGQFEATASYATSYIPTLGAAVTRGAETAIKTSATALIGQTEGTIFLEFQKNAGVDAANIAFSLSDGTSANVIYYNFEGPVIEFIASSSVQAIKSGGINLVAGTNKIAVYYKANDFGIYLNGTSIFTDTSGSVGAMSKFNLGSFFNDAYPVGTPINQAILFKTRLTNAQLAELTTL